MTLKTKTTLFIVATSLLSLGIILFVTKQILSTSVRDVESNTMNKDLKIASNSLVVLTNELAAVTKESAYWDDTYKYVQNKNTAYSNTYLTLQNMKSMNVDAIMIIGNDGSVIWNGEINETEGKIAPLPQDVVQKLLSASYSTPQNSSDGVKNILITDKGTLYYTALPILTSSYQGPIQGTLIFGRYLTSARIRNVANLTRLILSYFPIDRIPNEISDVLDDKLKYNDTYILPKNSLEIRGYSKVVDSEGNIAGIFEVTEERTLYEVGNQITTYLAITTIISGLIYIILGMLYLNGTIISPIKKLINQLKEIGGQTGSLRKVNVAGDIEINELAGNINEMIDALDKSRDYQKIINQELGEKSIKLEEKTRELEKANHGIEIKIEEKTHQMQEEKARLISAINNVPFGFVLLSPTKDVMLVNDMLNPILRINEHKWTLEKLDRLFTGVSLPISVDECLKTKQNINLDNLTYKNGFFKIEFSPVLIGHKETLRVIGIIMLVEDKTEETILERSKEEFFSIASHELRTPLSTIKGNAQLIKKYYSTTVKDKNFNEIVDDIYSASLRLIQLVNEFLTTSKLEQSQIKINKEPFNIIELVQNTVREMQTHALEKGLILSSDHANQEFPNVMADKNLTKEVLINLIGNAIKFTNIGSVQIYLSNIGENVKVSIKDTGRGISEKNQNLLFRKFQQASDSLYTRDPDRGSGLGLYISKLIMEAMGGKIFLEESKEGVGSVFSFTLPFKKV